MNPFIRAMMDDAGENALAKPLGVAEVRDSLMRLERLNRKHVFKEGQIVQWKEGLKNKVSPGPFVVVEVLEKPVFNIEENENSNNFREPLDIILGFVDGDDDFMLYHFDSRRLEPCDILERE